MSESLQSMMDAHLMIRRRFGTGNLVAELGEQIAAAVLGGTRTSRGKVSADLEVDPPAGFARPAPPFGIAGVDSGAARRVPYADFYNNGQTTAAAKEAYRSWLSNNKIVVEVKTRVYDVQRETSVHLRGAGNPRVDYFPTFDYLVILLLGSDGVVASCRKVALADWLEWVAKPYDGSRQAWDYKFSVAPGWIASLGEDLTANANHVLTSGKFTPR